MAVVEWHCERCIQKFEREPRSSKEYEAMHSMLMTTDPHEHIMCDSCIRQVMIIGAGAYRKVA
jgi:hypothetical protein